MKFFISLVLAAMLACCTSYGEDLDCYQTKQAITNNDAFYMLSAFQKQYPDFSSNDVESITISVAGQSGAPECTREWTTDGQTQVPCLFVVMWITVFGVSIAVVYKVCPKPHQPPPGGYHIWEYTNNITGVVTVVTDQPPGTPN
jgi:hypothetical protein